MNTQYRSWCFLTFQESIFIHYWSEMQYNFLSDIYINEFFHIFRLELVSKSFLLTLSFLTEIEGCVCILEACLSIKN